MASQRDWLTPWTILLPVCVLVAYGAVIGIGFVWPEHPTLSMVSAIVVSVVLWMVSGWWFCRRTNWWAWVGAVFLAGALVFPMVGSASLGTDLALETAADQVSGEVTTIDVEQVSHRKGREAWKTTYTFVAADDGRDLGTVDYRGGKDAYELEVGDTIDLLVDPSGDLPLKLAEEVDSGTDIALIVLGVVLYLIIYAIGLVWPLVRRMLR